MKEKKENLAGTSLFALRWSKWIFCSCSWFGTRVKSWAEARAEQGRAGLCTPPRPSPGWFGCAQQPKWAKVLVFGSIPHPEGSSWLHRETQNEPWISYPQKRCLPWGVVDSACPKPGMRQEADAGEQLLPAGLVGKAGGEQAFCPLLLGS